MGGAQQAPQFRSGIDLIPLDVSVLDRDRRPIRGLTAADFTVLEDGKAQKIIAFASIEVPDPPPPPVAWMRDIAPDVRTNEEARTPESRLFVLLLDDALIPFDPAAIKSTKEIARRVIDQVSPADRVAVVFSAGSRGAQNFTNDRAKLLAAVDTVNPTNAHYTLGWDTVPPPSACAGRGALPCVPVSDPDAFFREASMQTLRTVAETLIAAPERRKVLVFVSPGVSVDVASASSPLQTGSRGARDAPSMVMKQQNATLFKGMPELFRRMKLANVTMYPIDPTGAGGLEDYVQRVTAGLPSMRGAVTPPPPDYDWLAPLPSLPPPPSMFLARHFASISLDFNLAAASNTGGKAIVNTNDFAAGIDQIFRENGSYYLVGYATTGRAPGSLHRIDVRVNRPGVTVRTRSGYEVPAREKPDPKNPPPPPVAETVAGPVAAGELTMQVAVAPIAAPGGPIVAIVLSLNQPGVEARTRHTFSLQTSAFTPDGQTRGSQRHTATVTLVPAGPNRMAEYELLSQMPLAPGRYELRLGAIREADRAAGSVYADVDIPDFARAPLSTSGVLISALPSPPAAPKDAFAALAPVVPTSRRVFDTADLVTGFMRIYQGSDTPLIPASVGVRIVDGRDSRVLDVTDAVGVEKFDATTRAADYRFQIPVAKLAPGPFLLSFDVKAGAASVTRHVRFSVR